MKLFLLFVLTILPCSLIIGQDHDHGTDVFTGENMNIGGFIFPELFVIGTGGIFEPGRSPGTLGTTEHDPQNEATIQVIETHLELELNDFLTGAVYAAAFQGADDWEAALEEAYLHYHLSDHLLVGGGQFLNTFGFQSDRHVHAWDFVNQNLINSRFLNEGELITQGGEAIFHLPNHGVLTVGGGGVRSHEHEHDDEDGDHHLEAENAQFNDWVFSLDYKFQLPIDDSLTFSSSLVTGENGFGLDTFTYGFGFEKIWNAHEEGFGADSLMLRSEFIGRSIDAKDENGIRSDHEDHGFSTSFHYGLGDHATLSLRHDWVSEVEALELEDHHRISPAITGFLDSGRRIKGRLQYDYNQKDSLGEEHVGWLQFQIQWGGRSEAHRH
jgi:hypothetical protein